MRSNFIWFACMSFKCILLRSFYPSFIGSKKGVSFSAHVSTFSYHVMKAGQLQKAYSEVWIGLRIQLHCGLMCGVPKKWRRFFLG